MYFLLPKPTPLHWGQPMKPVALQSLQYFRPFPSHFGQVVTFEAMIFCLQPSLKSSVGGLTGMFQGFEICACSAHADFEFEDFDLSVFSILSDFSIFSFFSAGLTFF